MEDKDKKIIPNPSGPKLKVGDEVKITEGDLAGMIGEVVEFFHRGKNWVKKIKVVREDGKVEFIEVTGLAIEAVKIIEDLTNTSIFKKFAKWVKNLFKKKKNKDK
jgi:ribosomal protein L24